MGTSIIIVNYNTKDLLFNCITSIYATQKKTMWEIIVIDNASNDDSVKMLKEDFPEVICIRNDVNMGFGYANNQGIEISKFENVLLLNSDTILEKDILFIMERFMDKNISCGGITPEILYGDGSKQNTYGNFPTITYCLLNAIGLFNIFPLKYKLAHSLSCTVNFSSPREVPHILGVCMFLRKEMVKAVDGFDKDYFLYFEETDLCFRMQQNGCSFWVIPQIYVLHLLSKSSPSNLFKITNLLRSRKLYFKKRQTKGIWIISLISIVKLLAMFIKCKDIRYLKMIKNI